MPDSPLTPVGLDLGLVHCFTVVAEHRHFGRAAAALHVTQPTLSRPGGARAAGGPGADSLRPDLTTVPLEGVEPSYVALATRAGDRNRLVAAFRKSAQAHLTGPAPAR